MCGLQGTSDSVEASAANSCLASVPVFSALLRDWSLGRVRCVTLNVSWLAPSMCRPVQVVGMSALSGALLLGVGLRGVLMYIVVAYSSCSNVGPPTTLHQSLYLHIRLRFERGTAALVPRKAWLQIFLRNHLLVARPRVRGSDFAEAVARLLFVRHYSFLY